MKPSEGFSASTDERWNLLKVGYTYKNEILQLKNAPHNQQESKQSEWDADWRSDKCDSQSDADDHEYNAEKSCEKTTSQLHQETKDGPDENKW